MNTPSPEKYGADDAQATGRANRSADERTQQQRDALFSTQQLVDLVMNPRDPGYEAAAARHGGHPARHWYDRPVLALGCLIVGFVLVVAYVHTHRNAPETAKIHDALVKRVHVAESRGASLATTVQRLNAQLNAERDSALSSDQSLAMQLSRGELLAGQVAVHGPGLKVVLAEPPAPPPTAGPARASRVPGASAHILSDRDVRSVVNELWADGAEAISVNDIRLTPTSAIRVAGAAVLVDFQPIASPYTIRAIGSGDSLDTRFAASAVASRYNTLSGADGIGFSFKESAHLELPASTSQQLKYAKPATPSPQRTSR